MPRKGQSERRNQSRAKAATATKASKQAAEPNALQRHMARAASLVLSMVTEVLLVIVAQHTGLVSVSDMLAVSLASRMVYEVHGLLSECGSRSVMLLALEADAQAVVQAASDTNCQISALIQCVSAFGSWTALDGSKYKLAQGVAEVGMQTCKLDTREHAVAVGVRQGLTRDFTKWLDELHSHISNETVTDKQLRSSDIIAKMSAEQTALTDRSRKGEAAEVRKVMNIIELVTKKLRYWMSGGNDGDNKMNATYLLKFLATTNIYYDSERGLITVLEIPSLPVPIQSTSSENNSAALNNATQLNETNGVVFAVANNEFPLNTPGTVPIKWNGLLRFQDGSIHQSVLIKVPDSFEEGGFKSIMFVEGQNTAYIYKQDVKYKSSNKKFSCNYYCNENFKENEMEASKKCGSKLQVYKTQNYATVVHVDCEEHKCNGGTVDQWIRTSFGQIVGIQKFVRQHGNRVEDKETLLSSFMDKMNDCFEQSETLQSRFNGIKARAKTTCEMTAAISNCMTKIKKQFADEKLDVAMDHLHKLEKAQAKTNQRVNDNSNSVKNIETRLSSAETKHKHEQNELMEQLKRLQDRVKILEKKEPEAPEPEAPEPEAPEPEAPEPEAPEPEAPEPEAPEPEAPEPEAPEPEAQDEDDYKQQEHEKGQKEQRN